MKNLKIGFLFLVLFQFGMIERSQAQVSNTEVDQLVNDVLEKFNIAGTANCHCPGWEGHP
jgi:hypothetical protein